MIPLLYTAAMNKKYLSGLPLLVCLPAIIIYLVGDPLNFLLRYDQQLIEAGQWWRILSAHWVHLNGVHLLLNMGGMMVLWWLCQVRWVWWQELLLVLYLSLVTGLGLHYLSDVYRYVGFSGTLHGVMMIWPLLSRYYSDKLAILFAGLIVLKVTWEQSPWYSDVLVSGMIEGRVMTDAHLYGAFAALPVFLFIVIRQSRVRD